MFLQERRKKRRTKTREKEEEEDNVFSLFGFFNGGEKKRKIKKRINKKFSSVLSSLALDRIQNERKNVNE